MTSTRPLAFLSFGLCLQALVWGADPPPQFTPEGVVGGGAKAGILVPGAVMSIYGQYLGLRPGDCAASADKSICDTQVLIGDKAVELLFVSDKQINFKVPLDVPASDAAELRVVYRGQSSVPLTMRVGPEKTTVSVDQPAYAGMPVWLRVELPFKNGTIQYPYFFGWGGFGCNEVEVRRNGASLPLIPDSNALGSPGTFTGDICGSYGPSAQMIGRLPLHLLYDLRSPGTYEVRFTLRDRPFGALSQPGFKVRSEWTPFEVLPSEPNRRAEWLNSLREHPPAESAELLTDTLPGLLGIPDESSLEILTGYLYHPDSSVRRYARNGLYYWPEESVLRRLLAVLHTTGPSDVIVLFLTGQPGFGASQTQEIAAASLPFLKSASPVLRGGAIDALQVLKRQFPELKDADSDAVAAFVERRASQSVPDHPERK